MRLGWLAARNKGHRTWAPAKAYGRRCRGQAQSACRLTLRGVGQKQRRAGVDTHTHTTHESSTPRPAFTPHARRLPSFSLSTVRRAEGELCNESQTTKRQHHSAAQYRRTGSPRPCTSSIARPKQAGPDDDGGMQILDCFSGPTPPHPSLRFPLPSAIHPRRHSSTMPARASLHALALLLRRSFCILCPPPAKYHGRPG